MLGSLAYHDYEGVALEEDEKPRLVRDLGDKKNLMLRNHGLLTVGRSVPEAFKGGTLAWPALLRQLDVPQPGYRN